MNRKNDIHARPLELTESQLELNHRSSLVADLLTIFRRNSAFPRQNKTTSQIKVPCITSTDDEDEECHPVSRQALLSKIRQKKEVIGKLRCQPWNMNRKRRILRHAQKYLAQNESKFSKTHLYKEGFMKRWHGFVRWLANIKIYLIPWEAKIKNIESHFGSVVSSYFTFLRWVVFVNILISLTIIFFVVIPELLADVAADEVRKNRTSSRKEIPSHERSHADELQTVWHYDGYLKYSPLFYGYYSNDEFIGGKIRYAVPLAYFLVTLFVFAYSCFAILQKMAANSKRSKMAGSKTDQYTFNWKIFTGWDFTIGNAETASSTAMAIIIKIRESVAECKVQVRKKFQYLLFFGRVFANAVILGMLAFSIYCISFAVRSSNTVEDTGSLISKNQMPTIVATITHVFPMIFDLIGTTERYHPRTALRAHLTRVLVLYVLNYMTLIVALFEKMDKIRDDAMLKKMDEMYRIKNSKEILVEHHNSINQGKLAISRNFSSERQAKDFIRNSIEKFSSKYRRQSTLNQKTDSGVQVISEYGPVRVNNPNVILLNISHEIGDRSYKTIKIGPSPLPDFPRIPFVPEVVPTNISLEIGPVHVNHSKLIRPKQQTIDKIVAVDDTTIIGSIKNQQGKYKADFRTKVEERSKNLINLRKVTSKDSSIKSNKSDSEDERRLVEIGEYARIVTNEVRIDFCWETMIGQEIVKLVTMDLIITIVSILVIDFFRGLWIRYCSSWWCWDIETTFPEYGEFKVAENVLHIINNQGMIWLGLFFTPLLPLLNNFKLIIVLYIRGWACMSCNVPHREIFRASRSSNFYLMVLLLWLLLCTLPVGYVIASRMPSSTCGPFAGYSKFFNVVTHMLVGRVDNKILLWLQYFGSPGVVIPVLLLLILVIYFLVSLIRGLRAANDDLQKQLIHERTEEKKKIFELAGGGSRSRMRAGRTYRRVNNTEATSLNESVRESQWSNVNGLKSETATSISHPTPAKYILDGANGKMYQGGNFGNQHLSLPKSSKIVEKVALTPIGSTDETQASSSSTSTPESNNVLDELSETDMEKEEQQSSLGESGSIQPPLRSGENKFDESERDHCSTEWNLVVPFDASKLQRMLNEPYCARNKDLDASSVMKERAPMNKRQSNRSRSNPSQASIEPWPTAHYNRPASKKFSSKSGSRRECDPCESRETLCMKEGLESYKATCSTPMTGTSLPETFHKRRFRISVSPTRRAQRTKTETDERAAHRRYIIRQEIMVDSKGSTPAEADSCRKDLTGVIIDIEGDSF